MLDLLKFIIFYKTLKFARRAIIDKVILNPINIELVATNI